MLRVPARAFLPGQCQTGHKCFCDRPEFDARKICYAFGGVAAGAPLSTTKCGLARTWHAPGRTFATTALLQKILRPLTRMTVAHALGGRVALVTGAGRNIGRAIALTLAAAGAAVVINGRRNRQAVDGVAAEIAAMGGQALPVLADLADPAAVDGLVATAVARFGRLDILVNHAAALPEQALEAMTLADWHGVLGVILDGAFLTVRAALTPARVSVRTL